MERSAAHGFRRLSGDIIRQGFEQHITKMKTKFDIFVNIPGSGSFKVYSHIAFLPGLC